MIGSTASLRRKRGAGHRQIGPGRDQPGAGGQRLARRAQAVDQRERQVAAGTVAADRDVRGRNTLPAQEAPGGQRIFMRGRKGMFGRPAVVDRERARPHGAAGLRHHPAVAQDRARAIAAAVKEQQHLRASLPGASDHSPRTPSQSTASHADVAGNRPDRPDLVEPLRAAPPIRPAAALTSSNLRMASISLSGMSIPAYSSPR